MSRDHGADHCPARPTNREAHQGGNSARRPSQETVVRAGGGTNPRPNGRANYETDHSMLSAPRGGRGRDAHNIFTFYYGVGAACFQREYFVGDSDKFSGMALHAGFDYFDSLAGLQGVEVGP